MKIDKNSETWVLIAERIREQLDSTVAELKRDIEPDRTTRCRARIRAFEEVLSWADAPADTPIEGMPEWLT